MAMANVTDADTQSEDEEGDAELPAMQKIDILFIALGQETAGEVMKFLSDHEIEEITPAVANLKSVTVEMQDKVLDDFAQHLLAGEWVRVAWTSPEVHWNGPWAHVRPRRFLTESPVRCPPGFTCSRMWHPLSATNINRPLA
jgi:hypothetical protein